MDPGIERGPFITRNEENAAGFEKQNWFSSCKQLVPIRTMKAGPVPVSILNGESSEFPQLRQTLCRL